MAVILRREESPAALVHVPSDLKNAPRIVLKNSPVHVPPKQPGAKITARSDNCYTSADKDRAEVFKGTYKRYQPLAETRSASYLFFFNTTKFLYLAKPKLIFTLCNL